ncbi:MAG: hypothetical protein KAI81_05070, partial [Candidatus Marinimicrobia bacterium]|nr:hypothetical protein [Candidatus Neomarinimicrobiota bacterium]
MICISYKIYKDVLNIGFAQDKIAFIPNGVDTTRFCPSDNKAALKKELGLTPNIFVAVFISRLVR